MYDAIGAKISVVELTDQLMPGADIDLVKPLEKRLRARYEQILLGTKVVKVEALSEGIRVTFEMGGKTTQSVYDRVLVAVGRVPNGRTIAAAAAGVTVNERGHVPVDNQMRTNRAHIFAIGDIVGQPMLAHKATHERRWPLKSPRATGILRRARDSFCCVHRSGIGLGRVTEARQARGLSIRKAGFPMGGQRSCAVDSRDERFTKLLVDTATNSSGWRDCGTQRWWLISEVSLAIELGLIPQMSVSPFIRTRRVRVVGMAAEALEGTLTDLYMPKKA